MNTGKRVRNSLKMKSNALKILKAVLCGCVVAVVLILVFALLLKWCVVAESTIGIFTSSIKSICAGFVGFLCANSGNNKRVWFWGGIGGSVFICAAFLMFSLAEKGFLLSWGIAADVIMGFVAGIAGSMVLYLKRA